jgi:putative ABC transport system ATP-binding protein
VLRRDKIGFVFQGFNLLPRMSASRTWRCRCLRAVPVAERGERRCARCRQWAWASAPGTGPASCPAASSSAWPLPVHWSTIRRSCWPTSRPATWTAAPARIIALFKRLRDSGHTVVLVTHDPGVAAHADRIYVMHDGRLHLQEAAA